MTKTMTRSMTKTMTTAMTKATREVVKGTRERGDIIRESMDE
jgi:hypothetical protein